ncbi:sensor histidine kinase [Piscinibacter gummiphilus]|uniref:histidine kinase n=1 Tax=Piscinibacter gummiphilus TaxID=946333 RepID=A0ABZ0CZM6_9BURK|nr:PAS domain-containing protein [Piscinibacter gummiphilus]WOB08293.1 PAS domain-containing protein [Piscinibacter gummiphilus]
MPLYALAGALLAAATLAALVWRRRRPPARSDDGSSLLPAGTDYEQLFTLCPNPMFAYDVETLGFLAVNGAMLRRYGYTQDELLKMTLADIRPPEDVPAMQAMAREVREKPSVSIPGVWRHRRKDGSIFHVRVSGHALTYRGRPVRLVQVMDVSAEVALHAEREQMIAKLQHSREWLATAINAGRVALWERDLVTGGLVLGGRWAQVLGTTPRAFGAVTVQSFEERCHPDDLAAAGQRFNAYLKDPTAAPYSDEFRIRHESGDWIWLLAQGRIAERGSDGRVRRVVGTFVDISPLKAAQHALAQAQAAEQASAMKTQFLGRVSHELRTPLNAVIGFSQLLQLDERAPLTEQQKERVVHIERAGQHLLALITDLMDLSRIELGAVELQPESVDLPRLLDDSLAMVQAQADERSVTLEREIEPGLPPVQADPLRLRQCVLNLLSNAIKYGLDPGRLRVSAGRTAAGEVALSVWNAGVGMTPEQLARLYEPFNRLGRNASHGEGTGIGLAISRQLIERMGGRIEAESEAGAWARFTVTLRTSER